MGAEAYKPMGNLLKKRTMAFTDVFKNLGSSKSTERKLQNEYLPSTLIVATDFSEGARSAMINAVNTFLPALKKIILLNAYSVPSISIGSLVTVKDILFQLSEEGLEEELKVLEKHLGSTAVEIEVLSKNGELFEIINEFKLGEERPMVCLGTTGASNVENVYHGHTTVQTTQKLSNIPVFTLPLGRKLSKPKNVIYISDIQEIENITRIDTVVGCSLAFGTTIHVAHISERNILQPSRITAADRDLMPFYKELYPNANFTYQTLNGIEDIGQQLSNLAENYRADFIYMVVKEDGFLNDVFGEKYLAEKTYFNQLPTIIYRVED
ncbi:hypothetical protein [Luteibaculum oceani]|uniref:Universal stress protein n=1 Tax=Luteibaculum oceani TaxID=1294296 RepID=A0A5C6VK33_9FLAO|nr:hypothetical protein [Luteibaculum oceani]TXC85329.1 hypothetical protein FRX97_01515 [Luteibaculum oceani]